jgi:Lon protease-like protein
MRAFLNAVSEKVLAKSSPTYQLPIFPLHSVLFPGGTLSLKVFEQRYMDLAKQCLKQQTPFGIALIRHGTEVGDAAEPEGMGTIARIDDWDMQQLGVLTVRVHGESRFRIESSEIFPSGLLVAQVVDIAADDDEARAELGLCAAFLQQVIAQVGSAHFHGEPAYESSFWVGMRLTELLPLGDKVKQKMLELTSARMRLEILHRYLADRKLISAG